MSNEQSVADVLALLPCPFCGATPHTGKESITKCQLHGEPFQRFAIWCPHGCARINQMNEHAAREAWNTRADHAPELLEALAELAAAIDRRWEGESERKRSAAVSPRMDDALIAARAAIARARLSPSSDVVEGGL